MAIAVGKAIVFMTVKDTVGAGAMDFTMARVVIEVGATSTTMRRAIFAPGLSAFTMRRATLFIQTGKDIDKIQGLEDRKRRQFYENQRKFWEKHTSNINVDNDNGDNFIPFSRCFC